MKYLSFFILICTLVFISCEEDEGVNVSGASTVYICTGSGANVWHHKSNCRALDNCDGQVVSTTVGQLNTKKYKRACKICD